MSKVAIVLGSIFVGLLIVAFSLFSWVTGTYNNLVNQRETVDTSWAQVESQYQRRFDLIPNFANATKGYLAHEQQVFKDIADARTKYAGAQTTDEKVEAAQGLEGAFARLLVIIENYPNLKADTTVIGLMDELAGTENRINVARLRYNEVVKTYNISIKRFPANLIANMLGFREEPLFEAVEEASEAPVVDLEVNKNEETE